MTGCCLAQPRSKASHIIYIDTQSGRGVCTGTAIGKHALLTAEHCFTEFPAGESLQSVEVDEKVVTVNKIIHDGHDHIIVLLSDVNFKNIAPVKAYKLPKVDTDVYILGNPQGFRDLYRKGYITSIFLDNKVCRDGCFSFSMPIAGGDSGSALFDEHGNVVGLVSFSFITEDSQFTLSCGINMTFTKKQVQDAVNYGN